MIVHNGSKILLEYTLSTDDEVLDSTEATGPLRIEIGAAAPEGARIHPAIEKSLIGRRAGEAFEIVLDPTLAFGEVDPQLVIRIAQSKLPSELQKLQVGDSFESKDPQGRKRLFRVTEQHGPQITLDGNHPRAGQVLYLSAKILEIF